MPLNLDNSIIAYNEKNSETKFTIPISGFDPFSTYILSLEYEYHYGISPVVDLYQHREGLALKVLPTFLGYSPDWERVVTYIDPVDTESQIDLVIKAEPSSDTGGKSKSFIGNIVFRKVYNNNLYLLEEKNTENVFSSVKLEYKKINPTKYEVQIGKLDRGMVLVFLGNYSRHWKINYPRMEAAKPIHFSVNGYANGWYIPINASNSKATIYYEPQRYFYVGGTITVVTIVGIVGISSILFIKKRNEK
jgi:hypothetical protein